MYTEIITDVVNEARKYVDNEQALKLKETLEQILSGYSIEIKSTDDTDSKDWLAKFIEAKRVEGCSEKTIFYYDATIKKMIESVGKEVKAIGTEDIRDYLTQYQANNGSSKVTIDNIRRILSSFFRWLEDEDYILKSPAIDI